MSPCRGTAWSALTRTCSTSIPRSRARRCKISRLPRSPYVLSRSGYTQTSRRLLAVRACAPRPRGTSAVMPPRLPAPLLGPPERDPDLLERRVVGDHVEAVPFHLIHRLVHPLDQVERHQVRLQPDREVEPALAGDEYRPAPEHPVVDIPQPGGVLAVRPPSVDREQHGSRRRVKHIERLQPPGRVLGEQQPYLPPAPG